MDWVMGDKQVATQVLDVVETDAYRVAVDHRVE